jgi:hypothetical protein
MQARTGCAGGTQCLLHGRHLQVHAAASRRASQHGAETASCLSIGPGCTHCVAKPGTQVLHLEQPGHSDLCPQLRCAVATCAACWGALPPGGVVQHAFELLLLQFDRYEQAQAQVKPAVHHHSALAA